MKIDWCDPNRKDKLAVRIRAGMNYGPRDKIQKVNESVATIHEIFKKHNFAFLFFEQAFIDNYGEKRDIKDIISRLSMKKYGLFTPDELNILSDSANYIMTTVGRIKAELDENAIESRVSSVKEACNRRKEFSKAIPPITEKLVGKYKSMYDENAYYEISTDPFDIFTQSTGRTWAPKNCVRVFGQHESGLYSDIEHFTAVVYIKDKRIKGFDSAIARMSLRICEFDRDGKGILDRYSLGWDINWYRGNDSHDRYHIYKEDGVFVPLELTATEAISEIVQIIRGHGFNVEYKQCTTPFEHRGYSDIEGTSNTKITFRSKWNYFCTKCGTPMKKRFYISNSGLCPYHWRNPDAR